MTEPIAESLSSRKFDLIAFDWDGTLYDSTACIVRSIQEAVRDVGGTVPSDEAAAWVIGMALPQALAKAAPDVPVEHYPELANRYRYHYVKHQDDLSLFAGVLPMLNDLRERGYLLAVATGKSRRGLDHVLDAVELRGLFDDSRTADETAGKPHPRADGAVERHPRAHLDDWRHHARSGNGPCRGLCERGRVVRRARHGGFCRVEAAAHRRFCCGFASLVFEKCLIAQ